MKLHKRISTIRDLGTWIWSSPSILERGITLAVQNNPWFTHEQIRDALNALCDKFLTEEHLRNWVNYYPQLQNNPREPRTIGLVLAGNIPLVGFHDILSVFISGNRSVVKLSDKDNELLPIIIDWILQ